MKHLNEGLLRRLIDEPLSIADSQQSHLTNCPACSERLAHIRADAMQASDLFSRSLPAPNLPVAMAQVRRRVATENPTPSLSGVHVIRRYGAGLGRALGGGAAVAAMLAAIMLTPAGSWAQSFVTIFQPTQVTAVQLTSLDIRSITQLRHYGTIRMPGHVAGQQVTSAAMASKVSGMDVLTPSSLPSGIPTTVSYGVSPGATASFTFSAARARSWASAAGKQLPSMPAPIDGSTINVAVGATVVTTYGSCATRCTGMPDLVIGQMVAPRVTSTGANIKQLEDYVFSLPGASQQLATQLRSIGDPTSTLPIPIPSGFAHADTVNVQGVRGEAIGDQTGVGSLVVWEKDGIIYAVGGILPLNQVESIANALH